MCLDLFKLNFESYEKKQNIMALPPQRAPNIVAKHKKRLLSRVSGRGFFVAGIRYYIFFAPPVCY